MKSVMQLVNTARKAYWKTFGPFSVGVKVLAVQSDAVLLVKPRYEKYWGFPGGGAKKREPVLDAALRETREETGAVLAAPIQLMGIYSNFREGKSDHVALFLCRDFTIPGPARPNIEIERWDFFPLDRAARMTEVGSSTRARLAEFAAWDGVPIVGKW